METKKFEKEYNRLNPEQKKAVDTIEGTVMVMAGPGTGKTQILSLRIANILLKTDTQPENILALTFTNSGVHSMKKRLAELIGSTAHRVNIATFHGFCEEVIKTHPESFPRIGSSKLITDVRQLKIIEEIVDNGDFSLLRPWGDRGLYIKPINGAISELKRNGIVPDEFDKLIEKQKKEILDDEESYYKRNTANAKKGDLKPDALKPIEKNKELSLVYRKYQERLEKEKFYDYNDIIIEVMLAVQNDGELLSDLQENYQYVLVDEHQDTNDAQNKILERLVSFFDRPNLFIVGDDKQAIYRFQGASMENFLYFGEKFKDVVRIDLEHNYRSTQNILDGAHSLIEKNLKKISDTKRLSAQVGGVGSKISIKAFPSLESELFFVAKNIKEKMLSGIDPNNIAIVYRNNNEVFDIVSFLEKSAIPFVIEAKQDILSDNNIRKIIMLLRAINNFGSDEELAKVLQIDFLNLDNLDVYKILNFAFRKRLKLYDCIKSEEKLKEAGVENIEKMILFYESLSRWKKDAENENLVMFFEDVVRESGFLNSILSSQSSVMQINKLNKVFDEMKKLIEEDKYSKLSDFISFLDTITNYDIAIKTEADSLSNGVRLMTAHGTKGLEFDFVYVLGVVDKKWGNQAKKDKIKLPLNTVAGDNDDERRLFYVALTRAKKEVFVTYHKKKTDGKDMLPSQFIEEVDADFVDHQEFEVDEELASEVYQEKYNPRISPTISIKDKEYLNELFLEQGLNATALNNYLKCPWQYFFNNLIRLPSALNKNMEYGNVIHKTLENVFKKVKKGEVVGKDFVLKNFEENLENSNLVGIDYNEAKEKGLDSLSGYFDEYHHLWTNKNIEIEFPVRGVAFMIDEEHSIPLTGKLDKMEILSEDEKVNVVDYKTGNPKSRGDIEGTTKNSDGGYKRQLVFYKLLLDNFADGRYQMLSGEIDFINPDDKGKYKRENFVIEDEDVEKLKDEIRQASKEILDLEFWDKKCEDKKCEYCGLREVME